MSHDSATAKGLKQSDQVTARHRPIYTALRRGIEIVLVIPFLFCIMAACKLLGLSKMASYCYTTARMLATGKVAIVGPTQALEIETGGYLPKGLFTEAEIARRAGLETDVAVIDYEYGRRFGPMRDLGVLLRFVWSRIIWKPALRTPENHFNLLGVIVNNSTVPQIIDTIAEIFNNHANSKQRSRTHNSAVGYWEPPAHICFVNAHNFNLHLQQSEYRSALRRAELVLPDGIGVSMALRMAGGEMQRNLNGTDLFPPLARWLSENRIPLFVLGAEEDVLAKAIVTMSDYYPGLKVADSHSGYFTENEEQSVCDQINASGALVVIVGMGTPRQELWFKRNAARLTVALVFSMGGLLDFYGEKNRRAPGWMRHSGLEWVYRLMQEPSRMWRRYIIGNPVFLFHAWHWTKNRSRRR